MSRWLPGVGMTPNASGAAALPAPTAPTALHQGDARVRISHTDAQVRILSLCPSSGVSARLGAAARDRIVLVVDGGARVGSMRLGAGDLAVLPRTRGSRTHDEPCISAMQGGARTRAVIIELPAGSLTPTDRAVVHAHQQQRRDMPEEGIDILELFRAANGSTSVAQARLRHGASATPHRLSVTETYIVTSGTGEVHLVGRPPTDPDHATHVRRPVAGAAIDVVHIPAGTTQWLQAGAETVTFYCVCTPAFSMDRFEAVPMPADVPR